MAGEAINIGSTMFIIHILLLISIIPLLLLLYIETGDVYAPIKQYKRVILSFFLVLFISAVALMEYNGVRFSTKEDFSGSPYETKGTIVPAITAASTARYMAH